MYHSPQAQPPVFRGLYTADDAFIENEASPCEHCQGRHTCMFAQTNSFPLRRSAPVGRKLHAGEALYHDGDEFHALFVLRHGHIKKVQNSVDGQEQVTALAMSGDILGGSAFAEMRYKCETLALEDSEVCEIPLRDLHHLFARSPRLLRRFHAKLSEEIVEEQRMMRLLASMRAEQKMASYLMHLSQCYEERGYSPSRFHLRMSRTDIASHLGLTIESISRLFSAFRKQGLIRVHGREVELLEPERLQALAEQVVTSSEARQDSHACLYQLREVKG